TSKENTGRRTCEPATLDAFSGRISIKMKNGIVQVRHRKERFPPHAVIQGQFSIQLPGIAAIKSKIFGLLVLIACCALSKRIRVSNEKVGEPKPLCLATKRDGGVGRSIRIGVRPPAGYLRAHGELVVSAKHTQVIIESENSNSRRS